MASGKMPVDTARLPRIEMLLYLMGFCGPAFYSIYVVYRLSKEMESTLFEDLELDHSSFLPFLGRKKDIADFEWVFWQTHFREGLVFCFIGHVLVSRLMSMFVSKYRREVYLAYSFLCLYFVLGWKPLGVLLAHCMVFYAAALLRSVLLCWGVGIFIVATLNSSLFKVLKFTLSGEDESTYYLLLFTAAMSILRQLSFSLEVCKLRKDQKAYSLIDFLSYNFYIPLFFNGPVITYNTFHEYTRHPIPLDKTRLGHIVWSMCRVAIWAVITEAAYHLLYFCELEQQISILENLPLMEVTGIGYLHVQFFHVKYMVLYGFSSTIAMLDGMEPPMFPRCVSALYSFTAMWRYFDNGLHTFLVRYIYIPLGGSHKGTVRQLLASAACFGMVCYWHGGQYYLITWALLNWAGIVVESIGAIVAKTAMVQHYTSQLSSPNQRRLKALCNAPILAFLILFNLVFLGGTSAGYVYFDKFFISGFPFTTAKLLASMYCSVQLTLTFEKVLYSKRKIK
ncbi:protein-cysteine N-palmitoyltransferase HHAT-like isoform X1 [Branchiostoma floridae x Branchiostoma japonicum]